MSLSCWAHILQCHHDMLVVSTFWTKRRHSKIQHLQLRLLTVMSKYDDVQKGSWQTTCCQHVGLTFCWYIADMSVQQIFEMILLTWHSTHFQLSLSVAGKRLLLEEIYKKMPHCKPEILITTKNFLISEREAKFQWIVVKYKKTIRMDHKVIERNQ